MKGMPLPFDLEWKGFLDLELFVRQGSFLGNCDGVSSDLFEKNRLLDCNFAEPTSVLDSARFSCRPSSSSTLSSSFGCGGSAASIDTAGVAAVSETNPSPKWQQDSTTATSFHVGGTDSDLLPVPPSLEIGIASDGGEGNSEKYAIEDWESMLTESPTQEQSILRWIMGGVEVPVMGSLNKVLQIGYGDNRASTGVEFEFHGGFGSMDQSFFGSDEFVSPILNLPKFPPCSQNLEYPSSAEMKPTIFNPLYSQNPSLLSPPSNSQHQEQNLFILPMAKRCNSSSLAGDSQLPGIQILKESYTNTQLQEMVTRKPQYPQNLPSLPINLQHQQQQVIVDQLYKAAELVQTGNLLHAKGILARLNHQLSHLDKPFNRAALYFNEAMQLLIQTSENSHHPSVNSSPFNLLFKIGAYKAFSEISPIVQFANFTCNQVLLEALDGCDRIHIVDFDIGYGGQWASLIQELALRNDSLPSLKITALASPSGSDQIDLSLTRENLIQFASELNIELDFEAMGIDSLNSGIWPQWSKDEVVAVSLPVSSLANHQLSAPLALHFIKQLSPRIVVSMDRGTYRMDLSFANHVIHTLHSCSNLLESLDAANVNKESLRKIERFCILPMIEKNLMWRFSSPEKTPHWKTQFLSSGFTPVMFSNFTEAQAECIAKRTPIRGFQVEKRQSSLVLTWQRKELVSASAWQC